MQLRNEEREKLLREQLSSGKSVAQFSRERGMDPQVLYGLRKRGSSSEPRQTFARVQTSSVTVSVELPSGVRIVTPLESLNAVLAEITK